MNVDIARKTIAQAYMTLCITHSPDPLIDSELRKLEGRMMDIMEKFEELVA